MGIFNEFFVKEKPFFTGIARGFGFGGGGAAAEGLLNQFQHLVDQLLLFLKVVLIIKHTFLHIQTLIIL